jgi:hypothetical protein
MLNMNRAPNTHGGWDATMRCRVVPAASGGWDVLVERGQSVVSTRHCTDWHRVERVCASMGAWRSARVFEDGAHSQR